jgi:hypothetical protein
MSAQRVYKGAGDDPVKIPEKTFKFRTMEISGFGADSSYELGCQRMLYLGIKWLKGKKLRVFDGMHGYPGIIGVESIEKSQLGELDEIWDKDPFLKEHGMTGAMVQFTLRHLKAIHEEGFDAWVKMLQEQRKGEQPIEVDMWE